MAVEFRPVRCSIDPETGLFWVDDSLNYPRLVCEARTISALQRKIARLLDTPLTTVSRARDCGEQPKQCEKCKMSV